MTPEPSKSLLNQHSKLYNHPKRMKQLTQKQLIDLTIIIDQVIFWMAGKGVLDLLPKTKEELMNELEKFKEIIGKVDSKIVYYHVLFNGVVALDEDERLKFNENFDKERPLIGFVPLESGETVFSVDFSDVLKRTIDWIVEKASEIFPVSPLDLMKLIEDLCVVKREAVVEMIVSNLVKLDYIQFSEDGVMSYSLPSVYVPHYYVGHYQIPE